MSTNNVKLTRRLSESKDSTGQMRKILEEYTKTIDDMIPVQVVSYNRETNRATVKIMVQKTRSDGTYVDNSTYASVPVLQLGGGGYVVSFPVQAGDVGWLKSNDVDISNFLYSLGNSQQNTFRRKKFSDGIFIPDNINIGDNITSSDVDKFVLQKSDGSVKITLSEDSINIESSENVNISADNVTIDATSISANCSDIVVNASNSAIVESQNIILDGNVTITGNIILEGNLSSPSSGFSISAGQISLGGNTPIARLGDATSDGATITEGSSIVTAG